MRKLATMTAVTVLTAAVGFGGPATAQTTLTVNFDSVDTSGGFVTGAALDTYLAGFGITLTNVTATFTPLVVVNFATALTALGPNNVVAPSQPNILEQFGGPATSFTLEFATPLISFSFTRAGRCTPLAFPPWTAVAKDSSAATLSTVSEGSGSTGASCFAPTPSATFTLPGPDIKSVTFTSGNFGFFGRSSPAIDDLALVYSFDGIDIKPGSDPNSINLCSVGVIPVAILGSAFFDPGTAVDRDSIRLADSQVKMVGKADKLLCSVEDVNADSFDDLVCKILTVDLNLADGDVEAELMADLFGGGGSFSSKDSVNIVKDCP